jgi:hypothetical protein
MHFAKADITGDPREVYQRLSDRVMARISSITNPREG